jgi:hypothetical protein
LDFLKKNLFGIFDYDNRDKKHLLLKKKYRMLLDNFLKRAAKKLRRHFGKLKININGLDYQKQVRDEWV